MRCIELKRVSPIPVEEPVRIGTASTIAIHLRLRHGIYDSDADRNMRLLREGETFNDLIRRSNLQIRTA
jgi:hypothetical protein